jgi:hypothetical protein
MKRMKKMKIKFLIFINFLFDMKYFIFLYKKEVTLYICKSFWNNNSIIKLILIIKIFLIGIY